LAKYGKFIEGAEQLSLGVSMVVAVVIGVGIGLFLKKVFGIDWLLWVGVFWGLAAAFLNIKRAYKKQKAELDKLKDDPKYSYKKQDDDDEDDELY
jgi:F0F1-type ATP synthase assembly protein I